MLGSLVWDLYIVSLLFVVVLGYCFNILYSKTQYLVKLCKKKKGAEDVYTISIIYASIILNRKLEVDNESVFWYPLYSKS